MCVSLTSLPNWCRVPSMSLKKPCFHDDRPTRLFFLKYSSPLAISTHAHTHFQVKSTDSERERPHHLQHFAHKIFFRWFTQTSKPFHHWYKYYYCCIYQRGIESRRSLEHCPSLAPSSPENTEPYPYWSGRITHRQF